MFRQFRVGTAVASLVFSWVALGWSPARADFAVWRYDTLPSRYLADGTLIHTYGDGLVYLGGPLDTEGVDASAISGDGREAYVFGNTLGYITAFAFDVDTGEYVGTRGVSLPYGDFGELADGFKYYTGNYGSYSRANDPFGTGDLFFVGSLPTVVDPGTGIPTAFPDILNIVDTSTKRLVSQIEPPSYATIRDIAFGPGLYGPQSRVYLATNHVIYAYEEMPPFALPETPQFINSFELVMSSPPLPETTRFRMIAFGPDGYLYVNRTNSNDIERFDSLTGEFVESFVTNNDLSLSRMRFGPGGDLYVMGVDSNYVTQIWRYDIASGKLLEKYDWGLSDSYTDFFVLHDPVPEPGSLALLAVGGAFLAWRRPRRGT